LVPYVFPFSIPEMENTRSLLVAAVRKAMVILLKYYMYSYKGCTLSLCIEKLLPPDVIKYIMHETFHD